MRPVSILMALTVVGVLYMAILERDRLVAFATGGPVTAQEATTAEAGDAAEAAQAEAPAQVQTIAQQAKTAEAEAGTKHPPISVVALKSTARTVDNAVLLRGQTEALRQVEVRAETSGQVISEPLRKGTFVEKGQLLCEIDIGTREATLAEAEARLIEAQINYTAASKLAESGYAAETRAASARAALQSAEAAVKAAKKDIERLHVTAPFEGLLESDAAELGSLLQAGGVCATVIQLDPIKLVGFVPETQVDKVELGAMAGARLASGMEITGKVTFISRSADPLTRTFRVEVTVPNPDLRIRDGQTAEIAVAAEGAAAHLLPQSALTLDDEGTLGVRIVEEGDVAGFLPVQVLRDSVDGVWLTGLPETVEVIVSGQEYVVDGVPLKVTYEGAS
ncbi:Solvent efflux pump periplasmic linker SrpA precursor [Pseudoruegeria aquimaris]|uniref:Solvent efflux pump periplasmic linker SrpA n=1 Tax=Pseudoruegeria aquimaris TaxID=393663 RepID=A0A1Y5RPT1_9RHOB|nr:efflux RND transporter periplasmic adaptor subunit [Pseudoruegeria aquimaris]SLN22621.1 Solvent efflux pump periplasmic linker SrpA precursor [Pseudoruegeria aquimaris]